MTIPDRSTLLEHIHAVAHPVRRAVGEIDVEVGLELLALAVVHHVDRELGDGFSRQGRHVAHGPQVTLDAEHRRQARLQVDVRGAQLTGGAKHTIEDLTHRCRGRGYHIDPDGSGGDMRPAGAH